MALNKPKKFEGQEDNAIAGEAAVIEKEPAAAEAPAATKEKVAAADIPVANEASASTAVAAAPAPASTAVGKPGIKFTPALQTLKNLIDPHGLDFDTFPRITVGLDGFSNDKKVVLGKEVKLQLLSWNERYVVTTGEQDDDEATALVRFSLDGNMLDDGTKTVKEYIDYLVSEGYDKSECKKYYALYGFLKGYKDEEGKWHDVEEADQVIVAIQVPPRSIGKFTAYQVEMGIKVGRGILQESDEIMLKQEKAQGKSKAYAAIAFSRVK